MTVMTRDDLLGRPTGPMIPPDEAAASGRVSLTLVPKGTFVTYRRNPMKFGALTAEPNAYNTGRVRVLTPEHAERDFPAEGGTDYSAQQEAKMSYRTRAEAYKFQPYGDAKPVIGPPKWPAKQLFPYIPSEEKVVSVEHDIVPTSSRTSRRDSLVAPVDGDDSKEGFSPAKEMKGDLGMLYGIEEDEALHYGHKDPDSARGVDPQDILALVAWDEQSADWQLSGEKKKGIRDGLIAQIASKAATRVGQLALQRAHAGEFATVGEANDWIKAQLLAVQTKKAEKLRVALLHAGEVVMKNIAKQMAHHVKAGLKRQKPLNDYLDGFNWSRSSRSFHWSGEPGRGRKVRRHGMHGDTEYPEYADASDTTGWNGFTDNDDFMNAHLNGMGDAVPGIVTSLDQPAAAGTQAVTQAIQSGQISTTDQVLKAISTAAQAAAQIYTAKVAPKPPPAPGVVSKIAATVLPPDQPFYKQPLFWGGIGLLAVAGIVMTVKGGSSGGRRTTRRYRRNTFPTFNRSRRWKSRWA